MSRRDQEIDHKPKPGPRSRTVPIPVDVTAGAIITTRSGDVHYSPSPYRDYTYINADGTVIWGGDHYD